MNEITCPNCNNITPLAPGGGPVEWKAICGYCSREWPVEVKKMEDNQWNG